MKREEEFRSVQGQSAWIYYQEWMKANRRQVPKSTSFLHSQFFNSFMRFSAFVKRVHLPDPKTFILIMAQKQISPTMWLADEVYAQYLEHLDRRGDPNKIAEITVNTLFDIADALQCDVNEVFNHLTANEVIQLLRERRLSPWILLNSGKFKKFFINSTSPEERIIMESIIRPEYWADKFKKQPNNVEMMKMYVSELKL
jgi:hypothetical protein